jgi:hypothetical protein
MPRPTIRPLPALATTIRNPPIRRPFVPKRLEPTALLFGCIPTQSHSTLDEHARTRGVAEVVEFAFKVAWRACAVADDGSGVGERFADVAVVVSDTAVVECLRRQD